ncbi:MAG: hypothetical protein INR66_17935 [Gordonia polyisoprenivorans]|nr:hypothetical protein [Gordonia polyisoprenivorans]
MTVWGVVEVDEHQFYLSPVTQDPTAVVATAGILDVGERHVVINTGIASGPVRVGVSVFEGPSGLVIETYEDVAQASITIADEPLQLINVLGELAEDFSDELAGATGLRGLRVSATGRDRARDQVVDEPTEEYLIQIFSTVGPLEPALLREPSVEIRHVSPDTSDDPSLDVGSADASARLNGPSRWPE